MSQYESCFSVIRNEKCNLLLRYFQKRIEKRGQKRGSEYARMGNADIKKKSSKMDFDSSHGRTDSENVQNEISSEPNSNDML